MISRLAALFFMLLNGCEINYLPVRNCTVYPRLVNDKYYRSINNSNISTQHGNFGSEGVLDCEY